MDDPFLLPDTIFGSTERLDAEEAEADGVAPSQTPPSVELPNGVYPSQGAPQAPQQAPQNGGAPFAPMGPVALPAAPSRFGAGVGLLSIAAGGAAGWFLLGGAKGAGAGVLLAGAARNGLRAYRHWGSGDPAQKAEANTSATLAVLAGGVGGYLAYSAKVGDEDKDAG